jgi:hypothetical protein
MASTVASLIDALRSLLLQDPEDLMDDYEDFASMVRAIVTPQVVVVIAIV